MTHLPVICQACKILKPQYCVGFKSALGLQRSPHVLVVSVPLTSSSLVTHGKRQTGGRGEGGGERERERERERGSEEEREREGDVW